MSLTGLPRMSSTFRALASVEDPRAVAHMADLIGDPRRRTDWAPAELEKRIAAFHGADHVYQSPVHYHHYLSEGVYWLMRNVIDAWRLVFTALDSQSSQKVAKHDFQVWRLGPPPKPGGRFAAVVTCLDMDHEPIALHGLAKCAFPLAALDLFLQNRVLCFPLER